MSNTISKADAAEILREQKKAGDEVAWFALRKENAELRAKVAELEKRAPEWVHGEMREAYDELETKNGELRAKVAELEAKVKDQFESIAQYATGDVRPVSSEGHSQAFKLRKERDAFAAQLEQVRVVQNYIKDPNMQGIDRKWIEEQLDAILSEPAPPKED